MGGVAKSKGKKKPTKNAGARLRKGRRHTRDFDQIHTDTRAQHAASALAAHTEFDEDKPGEGQFYCLACARYFQDGETLGKHNTSARHKKRVRRVNTDEPWKDSDIQAVDNGQRIGRGVAGPLPQDLSTQSNAHGVSVLVGGVVAMPIGVALPASEMQ